MIFNENQIKEFEAAARPLIKFLNNNCHPHVVVIVDCTSAQLFEGVNRCYTEDYVKD